MDVTLAGITEIEAKIVKALDGDFWLRMTLIDKNEKYETFSIFFPDGTSDLQAMKIIDGMAESLDGELIRVMRRE